MGIVPFDTLKLARRLETAGFPPRQAGDTAEDPAEAMSGAQLATSADIAEVRSEIATLSSELRSEIATLSSELRPEIAALGSELRSEIAAVRAEIAAVRAEVKAEIELLRRDMTIRLGSMLIIAVGIILAAMRYFAPHP